MKKIHTLLLCTLVWASIASIPYIVAAIASNSPCGQPDTLHIAFLTDLHVTPGNAQDSLLRLVVEEINASAYDLVVVGGDLTNMGSDTELERVHELLSELHKPWHAVPGNHETTWSESAGATFLRLFGHDGRTAFRAGKYLFLGYASGPYMKMADGAVRNEDLAWIAHQTETARPGEEVVSLCHYPLSNDLTNRTEITSLLRSCGVRITLCGHYHRYALRNFDGIAGIQGRALVQKDDSGRDDCGYTLIELFTDSLRMSEKLLGEAPRNSIAIRRKEDPQVLAIPCDPEPEKPAYDSLAELILQDEASVYTGTAFYGEVLFYGNSQGVLRAWDTRRRRELWRQQLDGALYTTPLCTGKLVIAGSPTDGLHAFDVETGAKIWHIPTVTPVIGDGLVAGDALYIGLGNGRMSCIDTSTGSIRWVFDYGDGQAQGRPTLCDGKLLFGAWNTYLYCLDAATGSLLWKWSNGSPQRLYSPGHIVPRIAYDKVFIVAPDRYITSLDLATGREVWRIKKYKARETTGMSDDAQRFYVKTMDGELLALDTRAAEYRELWVTDAGWGYDHNSCPIVVRDGVVYMANRSGCVAAVREDGKLLWQAKLCGSAANDFRIAPDGGVWVSFAEGKIFRVN